MIPTGTMRPVHYAALAVLALILWLPGFVSLPATDRDEARFVQASRQMLESGNFVDIRFQDEARHKKPVGVYWLQSASAALFGGGEAPLWAYRLPSLLGAAAAVLGTAWIGAALFTPAAGVLAAVILAATILAGVEARLAKTDALLLAAVVFAQGAFARIYAAVRNGVPPPRLAWLFWAAVGVGILIKGPIVLLVCGASMLALRLMDRECRWLRALRPLSGLAITLAIVLPWLVAIAVRSDGAFFAESLGRDLFAKVAAGQETHGAPPGYHLLAVWLTFWPFGFLLGAASVWLWALRKDVAPRFLIAWIVPSWIVLELAATKLPHYVLPLFPALALAAAAACEAGVRDWPGRWRSRIACAGLGLHGLATLVLAGLFFAVGISFPETPWPALGLALTGALLAIPAALGDWSSPGRRISCAVLASLLATGGILGGVLPSLRSLWIGPRVANALAEAEICDRTRYASAGYGEPSLVFYTAADIRLVDGAEAARHLLADPACAVAAVEQRESGAFHRVLDAAERRPHASGIVTGVNYSSGMRSLRITIYRLR